MLNKSRVAKRQITTHYLFENPGKQFEKRKDIVREKDDNKYIVRHIRTGAQLHRVLEDEQGTQVQPTNSKLCQEHQEVNYYT